MTVVRGQRAEDRGRRSEVRRQRAEGRGRRTVSSRQYGVRSEEASDSYQLSGSGGVGRMSEERKGKK